MCVAPRRSPCLTHRGARGDAQRRGVAAAEQTPAPPAHPPLLRSLPAPSGLGSSARRRRSEVRPGGRGGKGWASSGRARGAGRGATGRRPRPAAEPGAGGGGPGYGERAPRATAPAADAGERAVGREPLRLPRPPPPIMSARAGGGAEGRAGRRRRGRGVWAAGGTRCRLRPALLERAPSAVCRAGGGGGGGGIACAAPGACGGRPGIVPGWAASPVPAPWSCKLAAMCRGPKLGVGFPAPAVIGGPRVERCATAGYQKKGWVGEKQKCAESRTAVRASASRGARFWQTHLRELCLPHGRKAVSETKRYLRFPFGSQFPAHVR